VTDSSAIDYSIFFAPSLKRERRKISMLLSVQWEGLVEVHNSLELRS